jgi:hypothetical protein
MRRLIVEREFTRLWPLYLVTLGVTRRGNQGDQVNHLLDGSSYSPKLDRNQPKLFYKNRTP